jgi:hypothetical protein
MDAILERIVGQGGEANGTVLGTCKSNIKRSVHSILRAVKEGSQTGASEQVRSDMQEACVTLNRALLKVRLVISEEKSPRTFGSVNPNRPPINRPLMGTHSSHAPGGQLNQSLMKLGKLETNKRFVCVFFCFFLLLFSL